MYSHKRIKRVLIATTSISISIAAAMPAFAQQSIPEQLQQINESIALLNAKRQELELRAQIVAKQGEIDQLTNSGMSNMDKLRQPVVQSIEGADGKMVATLMFGSGQQQTVKQGDRIPGGWTIAKIGVDSVHITRGKEKARLSYGYEPPPSPAQMTQVPPLTSRGQ
ncbi:MAG: type IV pilus biogenesis protein PilP [Sterolibacterium sp.]|nr:type IV pilus biogenesis protein PilP [Sterolibacterium sp.]